MDITFRIWYVIMEGTEYVPRTRNDMFYINIKKKNYRVCDDCSEATKRFLRVFTRRFTTGGLFSFKYIPVQFIYYIYNKSRFLRRVIMFEIWTIRALLLRARRNNDDLTSFKYAHRKDFTFQPPAFYVILLYAQWKQPAVYITLQTVIRVENLLNSF